MTRQRAEARHAKAAFCATYKGLHEFLNRKPIKGLSVREISGKADEAWAEQWAGTDRTPPNGGWDWPHNRKAYQHHGALKVAFWGKDETILCGLMLARLNNTACVVEFIEGSPNPEHPLKGSVIDLALEVAAQYAREMGRAELWVMEPANEHLIGLYVTGYGFEFVRPRKGSPFCRKVV